MKNFLKLSVGLPVCVVATMALFFFSCKEKMPVTKSIYKVTFNSRGGSEVKAIKVKQGDTLPLPANPTKRGYTFGGWYADNDVCAAPFSTLTPITADITLYAKWDFFRLTSISFPDRSRIPLKYAYPDCGQVNRLNVSPQLSWTNIPHGTTSFLILMEDITANHRHWCVYNIPVNKTSLVENDLSIVQTSTKYRGPHQALRATNTYQITVYALDLPDNYFSNGKDIPSSKKTFEKELDRHILAKTYITGTFTDII